MTETSRNDRTFEMTVKNLYYISFFWLWLEKVRQESSSVEPYLCLLDICVSTLLSQRRDIFVYPSIKDATYVFINRARFQANSGGLLI